MKEFNRDEYISECYAAPAHSVRRPHKHAELIKAWADGAEIEAWNTNVENWVLCSPYMAWDEERKYRIKPEPKPDVKIGYFVDTRKTIWVAGGQCYANLYLTFDGETDKLKSAEVLK